MLEVEGVRRTFGGVVALAGFSLELAEGEVLGLIGPNGSGKTTLFNVLTGVYPAQEGRVWLRGEDITARRPPEIARRGVARTFQNLRIYRRMTVFENVWAAQHSLPQVGLGGLVLASRAAERSRRQEVERLLEITGLAERAAHLAGNLPLPDQRRLELARALVRAPDLLLLDEPAGGMTPAETDEIADLIRDVVVPGRSCIVIEHKVAMLARFCDRMCVLNFGRKIAEGASDEVLRHPEVLTAYLGEAEPGA